MARDQPVFDFDPLRAASGMQRKYAPPMREGWKDATARLLRGKEEQIEETLRAFIEGPLEEAWSGVWVRTGTLAGPYLPEDFDAWRSERAAALLRALLDTQARSSDYAISILGYAGGLGTPEETIRRWARALSRAETSRLVRLHQASEAKGVSGRAIVRVVNRLGLRLRDRRAVRIATTEAAAAHNAALFEIVRQALSSGTLDGPITKRWITHPDDMACDLCRPLDGEAVGLDDPFSDPKAAPLHPPLHPHCRCVVEYLAPPS